MLIRNKKWVSLYILGSLLVLLFVGLAHAQENWVFNYDGPGHRSDEANAVVYGSDGNVYVAGFDYLTTSDKRFVVISLTPTGDTNWVNTYNGPYTNGADVANDIVYGNDNYIYAAGYSRGTGSAGKDFLVIKYDTLGNRIWVNRFNGAGYLHNDEANAIVYGNDGYVYAAGYVAENAPSGKAFCVIKYRTSDGNRQWNNYESMSSADEATSIVFGSDNYIYAAGYYFNNELCVVKLNTSGTRQWRHQYGSSGRLNSIVYATDGYIYSAGTRSGDFIVISIEPATGDSNWVYTYDGPGHGDDEAYSLVKGPGPALYAAGYSTDTTGGGGKDYTVICLSGFIPAWIYRYNGTGNGDDCAYSIDINGSGNFIYATGYSTGNGTGKDVIASKHSVSDTILWTYCYNGNNGDDVAKAIDVEAGNIYIAGYVRPSGSYYDLGVISLPEDFPPTVPALVSPWNAVYLNDTTVNFTWNASTDFETSVSGYYFAWSADPTFTTYDSAWGTDTTRTVILADTTWYWAVKAKDSNGNQSKWSDVWSFSFDLTTPFAPVLTSPINDGFELDTSVSFVWQPVTFLREIPSPVTYVIQIDTTSGFSSPIKTDTTGSTSIDEELLSGEYYYYWHVMAYDAAGNPGPYCANRTFMIDLNPPVIDSETVWEETSFCGPFDCFAKVTDMWGIDEVLLYYKRTEDPAWFSTPMSEGSGDWYLAQIPAGTIDNDTIKYYYYAMDNAEYETRVPATDYYWFIGNSTGVVEDNPETPNVFSFDVGSNLIKGKATFNLSLPRSASIILEIYDASGRRIATPATGMRSAGNHTITWTPQTNGIYFYSLKSQWKKETGKILFIE